MMRLLSLSGSLTLGLLFSGCASTVIPNAEVCADKGVLGAKCAYTRNGPESSKSKAQWDKDRFGWFCMDAKQFGKYQKFIEDACAADQNCVDEVSQFVNGLKAE